MKHRNMNQWVEVMVKGSIFFYLFTFLPLNTCAQPKQRRVQQSEQQQRKNPSSAMSVRAQIIVNSISRRMPMPVCITL